MKQAECGLLRHWNNSEGKISQTVEYNKVDYINLSLLFHTECHNVTSVVITSKSDFIGRADVVFCVLGQTSHSEIP